MNVFVTGASGWIGSAVIPQLLAAGHHVVGLARSDDAAAAVAALGAEVIDRALWRWPFSARTDYLVCGTVARTD